MNARLKDLLAAGLLATFAAGYSFWARDQLRPPASDAGVHARASTPRPMITRSRVPGVEDAPDAHLDRDRSRD